MTANPTSETVNVVCVSDLHTGSSVAICPPIVQLDDGGTYHASRAQRWLWECWQDYTAAAIALPGRLVAVLNGDIGELDAKRRSTQIVTGNRATVQRMAADVIAPLVEHAGSIIVVRGTPAHAGKSGWLEEAIAQDIDNVLPYSPDVRSWWHCRMSAAGINFDIAHHASMGGAPWSRRESAQKCAEKLVWYYMVEMQAKPPHIAIRSHNHQTADSGDNLPVRVLYQPAWTLATEYVYRIGRENSLADIGGDIIACAGGKYEVIKKRYFPRENKRVWALTV